MSQTDLRRRMTGADAMFLYFERKEMPLHIGCVAILDGSFDQESENLLAARLPELPRYRQRVLFSPFNLTHPCWEDDPEFDIRNHITRVRLDPPGTEQQLSELSGRVFTTLMERTKPLWDLTVVDGLEGGRSALIIRIHHSMVDGVSGVGLIKIMFDPMKKPRQVEAKPYKAPPLPEASELLVDGLSSIWMEAASRLVGAQLTVLRLVQAFTGESSDATLRSLLATMPELLRPAQRLPFNGACSGVRGHCWTTFPFAEARAIRAAVGGTINDVVLTTVVGAVSRYVTAHRESLKDRFIRLLVPVNLRSGEPEDAVGNEISMLPLSLPLDVDDPVERLKVVTLRSSAMKSARIADIVSLIGTLVGWTPPAMQQSLAAMPFLPQPVFMFNMVCTNVPGPMVPLYANGRELLTYYPHVPCGSEVGISVAISSYNQSLYYGVTYDAQAAPDGELFRDFLVESYEELRAAAGVAPIAVAEPVRQAPVVAHPEPDTQREPQTPPAPVMVEVEPEPQPAQISEAALAPQPIPETVADVALAEPQTEPPAESATTEAPPEEVVGEVALAEAPHEEVVPVVAEAEAPAEEIVPSVAEAEALPEDVVPARTPRARQEQSRAETRVQPAPPAVDGKNGGQPKARSKTRKGRQGKRAKAGVGAV